MTIENTDEAQLGANYKFVDSAMDMHAISYDNEEGYNELRKIILSESVKYCNIVERYKKTEFKRRVVIGGECR